MLLLPGAARPQPGLPSSSPATPSRLSPSALCPSTQGRLLVLLALVAFSFAGILAKGVYATGAEPLSLLLIRFAAVFSVLALLSRRRLLAIPWSTRLKLLAMGAGFSLQSLTFYSAIEIAPVGLVVVVVAVYPVLVVLLDAVIGRRLPGLGRTALLGVALAGLWLAAGSPTGRPDTGLLLALACAVIYAVYLKVSERVLVSVSPLVATTYVAAGALAVVSVVVSLSTVSWPSPVGIGLAVLHGLVTNALPVVALYAAITRLGASGVAGFGPLEPVMALGLAAVLLGERLTGVQLVGGVIVLLVVSQLAGMRPRALLPRMPAVMPVRAHGWWRAPDPVERQADPGHRAMTQARRELAMAGAVERLRRAER